MNMVTIRINGVEYNLKGEENEEYLHKVASYVDRKIKNIMGSNSKLSTTSAAVLTAINVVDDLFKCDKAYSELVKKTDNFEKNEKILVDKVEALKKQIAVLENQNESLKDKLSATISEDMIAAKDIEIYNLHEEISNLSVSSKQRIDENIVLKADNKELKFQLQSAKYKIIDLQNKIIENQIDLVKVKKSVTPFINNEKK